MEPQKFLPFTGLVLLLVLVAIKLTSIHKKKTEKRLRDGFGQVPMQEAADLSSLVSYHRYTSKADACPCVLDDTTWNDLNMDHVFQRINACLTSVGEEYLYHLLHELISSPGSLNEREKAIRFMQEHPHERIQLQTCLLSLSKSRGNGLSHFLFNAQAKRLKNAWIYPVLAILPLFSGFLIPFYGKAGLAMTVFFLAVNALVYTRTRMLVEMELITTQYFSSLLYAAKSMERHCKPTLSELGLDLSPGLSPSGELAAISPSRRNSSQAIWKAW